MRKRSEVAVELIALHTTPMKTFGQKTVMISMQSMPHPGKFRFKYFKMVHV